MGEIFNAIDKQILWPRTLSSQQQGFAATQESIQSFYSQGQPRVYKRTGAYGESPHSDYPSGGNGNYHYNIILNPPAYSTGTYSGQKVMEEAQSNGSGILGKPGTWNEAVENIGRILESIFS